MSYDNTTSFPPIHGIHKIISVYRRIDTVNNEVQTVTHSDERGAVRVTVTSQIYDRNAELQDLELQKNSLDFLI